MGYMFLVFILGFFLGAIIVWLLFRHMEEGEENMNKEKEESEDERLRSKEKEEDSNLGDFNDKRQTKVEKRKEEIMERMKKDGETQVGQVMNMFQVSRTTAYRYLEELEKEDRIEQAGKAGRSVRYIPKK